MGHVSYRVTVTALASTTTDIRRSYDALKQPIHSQFEGSCQLRYGTRMYKTTQKLLGQKVRWWCVIREETNNTTRRRGTACDASLPLFLSSRLREKKIIGKLPAMNINVPLMYLQCTRPAPRQGAAKAPVRQSTRCMARGSHHYE